MAKRSRVEKAIRVLRGVEVLQSQGASVSEACRKLDYPAVCATHHLCDRYHDLSTKLNLALRKMPHEASPLQPWEGLLWDRFNEKSISMKKALDQAIGVLPPPDLDEQIMRINADIAENGRQGRY